MKISDIGIYHLKIPFKTSFKHATSERSETGNLLTKITLDDGSIGWGEGVPRQYVTGETLETSTLVLTNHFIPQIQNQDFHSFRDCVEFFNNQEEFTKNGVVYNSAKCSLELAALDAFGKHFNKSVSEIGDVLAIRTSKPKEDEEKRYSCVLSIGERKSKLYNIGLRLYGFRDFKFKIDSKQDYSQIDDFINSFGGKLRSRKITLRVDANGSLDRGNLKDVLEQLDKRDVFCLEQPLPKGQEEFLSQFQGDYSIMLDESICSLKDAEKAIKEGYGDIFNLRISKNGGLINTLKIAQLAKEDSVLYQLGCMVGETGILSAAGRCFASITPDILFFEGSYGTHLLKEDITIQNMTFGFKAKVLPLTGPGLSISVNEQKLNKYAEKVN